MPRRPRTPNTRDGTAEPAATALSRGRQQPRDPPGQRHVAPPEFPSLCHEPRFDYVSPWRWWFPAAIMGLAEEDPWRCQAVRDRLHGHWSVWIRPRLERLAVDHDVIRPRATGRITEIADDELQMPIQAT